MKREKFGFSPLEIKLVNRANNQRNKKSLTGFTIAELLTVVAIIAILVALLIPALAMVRKIAKETQQKAQLTTIELALTAFKGDYGGYPPSSWQQQDYCGAQKLAEALLGRDLLGFHPQSKWDATDITYYTPNPTEDELKQRRGPYLELATANAFKLGDLFDDTTPLEQNTFVLCDVFGVKKITLAAGHTAKAGTSILYYTANTSKKQIDSGFTRDRIYDARDNVPLTSIQKSITKGQAHPLGEPTGVYQAFYNYIKDPKVTAAPWPYRPDSYILISAGADGLYGTSDDIRNF